MHERRYSAEIERLRSPERVERLEVERVVDLCLRGRMAATVLDAGTGSGLFAEAFAQMGMVVTGLDANPQMIIAARALVPAAEFKEATVESIPFAEKSFDIVFLGLVLHEADHVGQALSECKRTARQRVCILEWAYRQEDFGPPLEHRLQSEDVLMMARRAGFHKSEVITLKSLLLYVLEV